MSVRGTWHGAGSPFLTLEQPLKCAGNTAVQTSTVQTGRTVCVIFYLELKIFLFVLMERQLLPMERWPVGLLSGGPVNQASPLSSLYTWGVWDKGSDGSCPWLSHRRRAVPGPRAVVPGGLALSPSAREPRFLGGVAAPMDCLLFISCFERGF